MTFRLLTELLSRIEALENEVRRLRHGIRQKPSPDYVRRHNIKFNRDGGYTVNIRD